MAMATLTEQFVHDGDRALANFEIIGLTATMIEAQADTGSRYMVYVQPADPRNPESDALVAIRWPWQAVYEITPGSYVTPDYFVERLGAEHRGRTVIGHYHGGDVYALLECLRRLIGISFPSPAEYVGGVR